MMYEDIKNPIIIILNSRLNYGRLFSHLNVPLAISPLFIIMACTFRGQ